MKKAIHLTLKYLWVIREYKGKTGEEHHKFNLWNPLGYLLLLITATLTGLSEAWRAFWKILSVTIKDAYNS